MNQAERQTIYSVFTQNRSRENREFFVFLLENNPAEVGVEGLATFFTANELSMVEMAYAQSLLEILSPADLEEIREYTPQSNSLLANTLIAATFGLPGVSILDVESFEQVLQKEEMDEQNVINLCATLHSVFQVKESRAYIPALVEYINRSNELLESSRTKAEIVFLTLALYTVWSELFYIPLPSQNIILAKAFCLSSAMGLPVQYFLEEAAKEQSVTIENYIYYTAFLSEGLKSNQEKVRIGENMVSFGSVAQQIANGAEAPAVSGKISECFALANKIVKGELLSPDFFDQKDKSLQYAEDMQKLILWFFVQPLWSKIIDYYNSPEPLVPVRIFLRELMKHDILNDESVEKYAEFSSFLQENNLLDNETPIILFNESTGEFEWNTEILN